MTQHTHEKVNNKPDVSRVEYTTSRLRPQRSLRPKLKCVCRPPRAPVASSSSSSPSSWPSPSSSLGLELLLLSLPSPASKSLSLLLPLPESAIPVCACVCVRMCAYERVRVYMCRYVYVHLWLLNVYSMFWYRPSMHRSSHTTISPS